MAKCDAACCAAWAQWPQAGGKQNCTTSWCLGYLVALLESQIEGLQTLPSPDSIGCIPIVHAGAVVPATSAVLVFSVEVFSDMRCPRH